MKKLLYILILYLAVKIILLIFGLAGSQDSRLLHDALHYFPGHVIETGTSLQFHRIIPFTLYSICAITSLFLAIRYRIDERLTAFLKRRIKFETVLIFISTALLLAVLTLLKIPFATYAGYYIGKQYLLVHSGFGTWLLRYLASGFISILAISFLVTVVFTTVKKVRFYLVLVPVILFTVSAGFTVIYPRYITPLFYETTTVPDRVLEQKLTALAQKAGIDIKKIRVINKSRYNSYLNAYLVGFGDRREIYLYDTLLKKLSHDEVLSIVAHEMGHYVEEHMLIGLCLASFGSILFLVVLSAVLKQTFGHSLAGMLQQGNCWKVLFIINLLLFFIQPVENGLSRIIEKRADNYALNLLNKPDVFIKMKVKSAALNRAYLLPHPVYSWFYYTHPPVLARIKNAETYKK